jgi:hypothetical protein
MRTAGRGGKDVWHRVGEMLWAVENTVEVVRKAEGGVDNRSFLSDGGCTNTDTEEVRTGEMSGAAS